MEELYSIDSTKLRYHIDKLYQWKYGDRVTLSPTYVEISPVGYCNHRCQFCALDFMGYKNVRIEGNRLDALVNEMADCGVRSIMFGGEGEPTLHPDLPRVIASLGKRDVGIALTTNGVPLNERYLHVLPYLDWIKLSVNGGDRDTYLKVHNAHSDDWVKLWNNVVAAAEYLRSQRHKTVIGMQCVVLPENLDSLYSLAKRAKKSGCRYLVFKPYSQHHKSDVKLDVSFMRDSYEVLKEVISEFDQEGEFSIIARTNAMEAVVNPVPYPTCLAVPYFWAYVTAEGDVYGCSCFLGDHRFKYGNITGDKFAKVWLGGARRDAMKTMETMSTKECRQGCRMDRVNRYLWDITKGCDHQSFI